MSLTIALLSPGAMGSAVAARLTAHGATVLTSLEGRSEASCARARAAGMDDAPDKRLAEADIILSILPPAAASEPVDALLDHLGEGSLYIDCNALSPETKQALEARVTATGAAFVDGVIIGSPPSDQQNPVFYFSGAHAQRALPLGDFGLDVRTIDGPVGAAAALKMCFAGINKGVIGLGTAILLAAQRHGAGDALRTELDERLPHLLGHFERGVPGMYPKAYRWIAEMREIADFLGDEEAGAMIYEGFARLYGYIAHDGEGAGEDQAMLDAFFAGPQSPAKKHGAD
ncbi:NAD(P)-dependent oxidoreductase [Parasphingopyxis marina]|uniref:NAD(P)-dependent oxidoreductase n=1 Tax=Parasphingopyxis marina TaxID=2761622 RepID=A0A842HY50_9SPHN|nr:NAD(P)-dependent oxidoreductase [Parasphingopyxis marina]MBC2777367.1 NAD(P)-dependent oxidoreductase [Parasphingopyxis marina]